MKSRSMFSAALALAIALSAYAVPTGADWSHDASAPLPIHVGPGQCDQSPGEAIEDLARGLL